MVSGIAAVKKPFSVTVSEAGGGIGYGFAITMTGTEAQQQAVYDWAYTEFGHNAQRWSIGGTDTFYVDSQVDANAIKNKFDPA